MCIRDRNDYNSMHGAGFSIAPIFTQSAWFRYHNKDKKIKNLYFSAAGSHPGAGIPAPGWEPAAEKYRFLIFLSLL